MGNYRNKPFPTPEAFEARREQLTQSAVKQHLETMERFEKHTIEMCRKDVHLWEGGPTGGRDGHCVSRCIFCDIKNEGWD